jgi:Bacterial Ig-like domain (group 3)
MRTIQVLYLRNAGIFLSSALLAFTANSASTSAQEVRTTVKPQQSLISVAPASRPQGESLARHTGDATFLNPPANYHVFTTATAGVDAGVEQIILNFAGETALTRIESKSKDFVLESGGTCHEGNHYAKGDSCSLMVRFNPQGPGHRLGHLEISHSAEASPFSLGLTGNGYAPVVSFIPSQITTVASSVSSGTGTIKSATNLAVDGGDIIYIADTGNNLMKKMDSSGAITNTANSPIATPASVAVDSFGILYTINTSGSTYYFSVYYPWGSETAFGYAHTAGTCTASAPCALSAVGMSSPANMSIDNYDNLFFEEGTKGAAEMPVASIAGGSGAFNLWYLSDQFSYSSGSAASFASDAYGNIYTKYNFTSTGVCYLLEEPLYNAENSPTANRVAGGSNCGFTGDGGEARGAEISSTTGQIAFDIAGNLYFADAGNQRVRRIDATTGIINTIAGTGTAGYAGDGYDATAAQLSNPTGLTVDSQGQVYILSNAPTAGPTQVLRKLGVNGFVNFHGGLKGTPTAAHVVTVSNTGNNTLILAAAGFFNGTNPTDFSVDPNTTTCVLTTGATLNAGASCKIGFIMTPSATTTHTANFVLHDNSVTGTNTILLAGYGTLPTPTMKITSPASGASFTTGTTITFSASVTSTTSPAPTGTVQFKVNGANLGTAVTLSSGSASTTFSEPTAGTYSLSAVYSGDANYATNTVTESITVTTAATAPKLPVRPVGPVPTRGGLQSMQVQ